MLRQFIARPTIRARVPISQPARCFSTTLPMNKGVVDAAKDVLEKANKVTGEILAGAIETTEKVAPTPDNIKDAAETVNRKTGEVLADGIEKAEEAKDFAKDKAGDIANDAEGTAKDLKHKAKGKAAELKDQASDKAGELKDQAGELKDQAADKAGDLKDEAHAKKRVLENTSGYKDLQDKGSKIESEQNRPDDAV